MIVDKRTWCERKIFAKRIQKEIFRTIASLGVGHLGGALSLADLLSVLYSDGGALKHDPKNPRWKDRDWLICSKGHAGPALYATLALRGYFPLEELDTLNKPHTNLPSHCDRNLTPGIDMTTGSLGQGASTACGIALAHRMNGASNTIYLIIGDGEAQEGQVWEMALLAAQKKLDNLIAFIDYNHMQIDGTTDEINSLGDVAQKFREFGWFSVEADGHDPGALQAAIDLAKTVKEKPSMIVMKTVKGEGWSKSAGAVGSHSRNVSKEEMEEASAEIDIAIAKYREEAK
ncbi:MAG: transketolase [Clostridiales Family XIII bacterium]|jgi:transketolase|nr:transketolase [Clostridiales Family XIII bacterium]